jgi:uncharacterized protein involved in outer membrane biogenesis
MLANYDWNQARPWLNDKISESIDRPFEIRGALSLTWQRKGKSDADRTWRDYLPLPHLLAKDVHIGNPKGMQAQEEMASVGQFAFAIDPLGLLAQKISRAGAALRQSRGAVAARRRWPQQLDLQAGRQAVAVEAGCAARGASPRAPCITSTP